MKPRKQLSRRHPTQNIPLPKDHFGGLSEKPSSVKSTFTTQCVDMAVSVGLSAHLWTGTTTKQRPFSNITVATDNRCRKCFSNYRDKIIDRNNKMREDCFKATMKQMALLRKAGYRVIEVWACEVGRIDGVDLPKSETKIYPHVIFYDFEAYSNNNQQKELIPLLTIKNAHIPISVSIGDTLEREPTHIQVRDPVELVCKFMEELERRGKTILAQVRAEFLPECVGRLSKQQKIREWCDQVPVIGFNSGGLRPESDQKPLRGPAC